MSRKKNKLILLKRLYKAERKILKKWHGKDFVGTPYHWNIDKNGFEEDSNRKQIWKRSQIKRAIWAGYGIREKALCKNWQRSRRWRGLVEVQLAAGIPLKEVLRNVLEQAKDFWQSRSANDKVTSLCSLISNLDFCSLYPAAVSGLKDESES